MLCDEFENENLNRGIVPGQLLGSHFLEYQQRMTNTVQTGETTLLQLLLVIYGDEGVLKRQIKIQTF